MTKLPILSLMLAINLAVPASAAVLPDKVLWAWQRPEDLSFINPNEFGVAYLACRILLSADEVKSHWRNQYLKLPSGTVLVPTIRIDTDRQHKPSLSDAQIDSILNLIVQISQRKHNAEIQIDFDALETERCFYRKLLERLSNSLPEKTPVSITALASWCLYDNWIKDLPANEIVPMMFSLGRDRQKLLLYFQSGKDFLVPAAQKTLGISLEDDEVNKVMIPLVQKRKIPVRVFVFSRTAWNASKVETVRDLLRKQ